MTLCGEMGGEPLEAMTLMAIGYRELSMSAASIGPAKATLIAADLAETEAFLTPLVGAHDGMPSLRAHLRDYARRRAGYRCKILLLARYNKPSPVLCFYSLQMLHIPFFLPQA